MVRVRCVVPVLLMVAVSLPLDGATRKASGSTRPPAKLHRVGDHWTAYNPPDSASFPAGARVHTIARGETLWGLAQQYYSNPYLWPQLWEANTYITDAHWIYPGDPLLISGESTTGAVPLTTDLGSGTTADTGGTANMAAASAEGSPVALGTEADIYCYGYLGDPNEEMPNRIASFEDVEVKFAPELKQQETGVAEGDVIYITGGTATGLLAGESYIIIDPQQLVLHPVTKEVVGRHYDYRGQVRILCATEDQATAVITQSCKDAHIGDRLKPIPMNPIPLARQTPMPDFCSPASGKASGTIVSAQDYAFALGEGTVVQIDLGKDDFVEPGDFLTVYRDNPGAGNPRQVLGEVGILTAENNTATAKIMRMRYSMRLGDRVELK